MASIAANLGNCRQDGFGISGSMEFCAASPFEFDVLALPACPIDEFVFAKLKEIGIKPAHPCSDAVFFRRANLDVIGAMPTAQEAARFLEDRSADKRAVLVDALLDHDEFADYWSLKWSDILRVKSEFPINLWPMAAHAYHRWIRTCIAQNWPYDKFARALLMSDGVRICTTSGQAITWC